MEHEIIVEFADGLVPHGIKRLNQDISLNSPPSAIEGCWQYETHLRVALKGAQLEQATYLRESIEPQIRLTNRIQLGARRREKFRPDSGAILRGDERS